MSRYLSWLANGTLLVLCCFLVANTANAVIASMLAPAPDEVAPTIDAPPPLDRSWNQRELILKRNLFRATLQAQKPPPAPTLEELEATKLPLSLIGTAAAERATDSWAAVQDHETREHLVLQQGDDVKGKAKVERIEPKRIVLRENGQLRELTLSDDPPAPKGKAGKRGRNNRTARAAQRRASRRAARAPKPAAPAPAAVNPLASAAQLFSQANIVPKFEDGEMIGMEVSAIASGSAMEAAGLQDGDVITELNGVPITSPEEGQQALGDMAGADSVTGSVTGADGNQRTITIPLTGAP